MSFKNIFSFEQATEWLANTMDRGKSLIWPMYEVNLGDDSSGGTNLSVYSHLNRAGILTMNSQDGYCDKDFTPTHPDFNNYVTTSGWVENVNPTDIIGSKEVQISYLQCIMPNDLFDNLIPHILKSDKFVPYILYHPLLGDGIIHMIDKNGNLIPSGQPISTTSTIKLRDGSSFEFPAPLGTIDKSYYGPKTIDDLKQKPFAEYSALIKRFTDFGCKKELINELVTGDFIFLMLFSGTKCTYPRSVGLELLDLYNSLV